MESQPAQQVHGRAGPHAALHLEGQLGELDTQIMQHLLHRKPTNDATSRQEFEQQVRQSLLAVHCLLGMQWCSTACWPPQAVRRQAVHSAWCPLAISV